MYARAFCLLVVTRFLNMCFLLSKLLTRKQCWPDNRSHPEYDIRLSTINFELLWSQSNLSLHNNLELETDSNWKIDNVWCHCTPPFSTKPLWIKEWGIHDDVIKWKHFPCHWPFVRGGHRSPVDSPHKGQWRRALVSSLMCIWKNAWASSRDAGDLRRHGAHCNVSSIRSLGTHLNGVVYETQPFSLKYMH